MRLFLSSRPPEDTGRVPPCSWLMFIKSMFGMTTYGVCMLLGVVSALTIQGQCKAVLLRFPLLLCFLTRVIRPFFNFNLVITGPDPAIVLCTLEWIPPGKSLNVRENGD